MSVPALPIFDRGEIRSEARAADFRRCLAEQGVFYLRHGDSLQSKYDRAAEAALRFFAEGTDPEKNAMTNGNPKIRRGYSALATESTARSTGTGDYPDYSIAYSMGLTDNLFPSPAFEAAWRSFFDHIYALGREAGDAVLRAADAGDCPRGFESFLHCDPVLRLRHFPEVPSHRCAETQPRRMAAHYDLSIVSVIMQTPCANGFVSLQCRIGDRFVDLPTVEGTVIVMCGAVASIVTGGRVVAPHHQVAAPRRDQCPGSERSSSVLFLRPKPEFGFSVALARKCGFDVDLPGERTTFAEWVGTNYAEMRAGAG